MLRLEPVHTDDEIYELAEIASEIWNEYFPDIIGQAQVDYMVSKFQSADAIRKQLGEGYYYFYLYENNSKIGYVGIVPRADKQAMQISKFYLLKNWRGKGLAGSITDEIAGLAIKEGYNRLYLTVNKYNQFAIHVYEKIGFLKTGELKMDIGNGFVMDDYEMERII
jgi:diamine N-acetyltransferase